MAEKPDIVPRDPMVIQPHDPRWAQDFDVQRAALEHGLDGLLVAPVEHLVERTARVR